MPDNKVSGPTLPRNIINSVSTCDDVFKSAVPTNDSPVVLYIDTVSKNKCNGFSSGSKKANSTNAAKIINSDIVTCTSTREMVSKPIR